MSEGQSLPGPEDPEAALAAVVSLRRVAGHPEIAAVVEAITQDWTWAQVGDALGISAGRAQKNSHPRSALDAAAERGSRRSVYRRPVERVARTSRSPTT